MPAVPWATENNNYNGEDKSAQSVKALVQELVVQLTHGLWFVGLVTVLQVGGDAGVSAGEETHCHLFIEPANFYKVLQGFRVYLKRPICG